MSVSSFSPVKIIIGFVAAVFCVSLAVAQETTYRTDALLSLDSQITFGKLDNGLTYYIRENRKPEKRAELRLVVKAGSVLEDDDQLGLAHFIEHMAFNGTKSFPKNELINFLEKEGVKLGPDVNAYTSFDETVYMLQIPTDSAELVSKAFQILEEWAHAVTFDDNEIDKERGVVIEEWRLGRGAFMRTFDKHVPTAYHNSQYAKRIVIGKKEVLEHAPYETVRRFYHDWYRPDLMAVMAVGDFDKSAIEKIVKDHFAKLTSPSPKRVRTRFTLPDHVEALASVATDKELPMTSVQVIFKRDETEDRTVGDYRGYILGQLYDGMLNVRIQERLQQANPPFAFAYAGDQRFVGHTQAFAAVAQLKEQDILGGLDALLTEVFRVQQHGFTASELERQKKQSLRGIERAYLERDKTESRVLASEYIRHFLQGELSPGIAAEYALYKQFLPGITADEVNALSKERIQTGNRVILLSAPDKPGLIVPGGEQLLSTLAAVSSRSSDAYVDKVLAKALVPTMPKGGSILSERKFERLGVTEWKLSNGATVVLKPTEFKNDEILFSAYSQGGTSLSSDADFMSARVAAAIVSLSGVGEFDAVSLQKLLAGKTVNVSPMVSELSEGFQGQASPSDLETLFQLTYMYFTSPRRDTSVFQSLLMRQRAMIENRQASPEQAFRDTVNVTIAQHHFRARPLTLDLLSEINLDAALKFYADRFADASDFIFFFVGNITPETIKPLVGQYLAALPSVNRRESWRDVGMLLPKGLVNREVRQGIEPKSLVNLTMSGPFAYTRKNRYDFQALNELLDIKLRDILREEKSGTYGVMIGGAPSNFPRQEYTFTIMFGCDPRRVEELTTEVMRQIDSLKMKAPDETYVTKIKELQRRNRELSLKENQFWLSSLRVAYANGEDPEEMLEYLTLVNNLTADDLLRSARTWLDTNNLVKVVLFPASP